jgi:hypothetical protein
MAHGPSFRPQTQQAERGPLFPRVYWKAGGSVSKTPLRGMVRNARGGGFKANR